jgi:hypothetical protein
VVTAATEEDEEAEAVVAAEDEVAVAAAVSDLREPELNLWRRKMYEIRSKIHRIISVHAIILYFLTQVSFTESFRSLGCLLNVVFHVLRAPRPQDTGTPLLSLLQFLKFFIILIAVPGSHYCKLGSGHSPPLGIIYFCAFMFYRFIRILPCRAPPSSAGRCGGRVRCCCC